MSELMTPFQRHQGEVQGSVRHRREGPRQLLGSSTPDRSLAQRMSALDTANKIRTERAKLKRDLKAGREKVHDLLLEPPEYIETMKVFDLLLACPKYGRVKTGKVFTKCQMSASKTVGGLSPRQRSEVVSMVRA